MAKQPLLGGLVGTLAALSDPLGVLSLYVDADPGRQATAKAPWSIELENGLRLIREQAKSEGPRECWVRLFDRLEELEPELVRLTDASEPGRGRALFAPLSTEELHRASLQMPLPNCAVLEQSAYLRPLLAALDEGRPAGIIVCSQGRIRVLEESLGVLEEVVVFELSAADEDWREMKGPAAANPAVSQQTAPQRDRYSRRVDNRRTRELDRIRTKVDGLIAGNEWDRLLVIGDPRLTERVGEGLVSFVGEFVFVDRTLDAVPLKALAEALAPELEQATRRRELALVEQAAAAAAGGGAGALGLSQTAAALAEGRVSHLLFDAGCDHRGVVAPDGRLFAEGTIPPGLGVEELTPEPRLVERMIERALATGAEVTPLEGAPAEALAEHDGIAARLRW